MINSSNRLLLILALIIILFSANSHALSHEKRLEDKTQEQRARNLFLQTRCIVCQGQVIENSDSEFSHQMRQLIRQKIKDGKSDEEIKTELIAEFGDAILTEVSTRNNQILLWILPILFGILLCTITIRQMKQKNLVR